MFLTLDTDLSETPLSTRLVNKLKLHGIHTVVHVQLYTEADLYDIEQIGAGLIGELKDFLAYHEMHLRLDAMRQTFLERIIEIYGSLDKTPVNVVLLQLFWSGCLREHIADKMRVIEEFNNAGLLFVADLQRYTSYRLLPALKEIVSEQRAERLFGWMLGTGALYM